MSERSAGPIGIGLGVVLLGAVAAFGIALPKATDDDAAGAEPEQSPIVLPDELPHGLVAQDEAEGPPGDNYAKVQKSATDGLEELYDVPAAVRGYATEDGSIQATVTVLDRPPGLFDPHGPPIDPSVLGLERSLYEMRRVGDAVCEFYWEQVVPEGQPVDDAADPRAMQCQLGDGDRTIELFASGLSVAEGADVLESLTG